MTADHFGEHDDRHSADASGRTPRGPAGRAGAALPPCTVLSCAGETCSNAATPAATDPVVDAVRDCVRTSGHGVLIRHRCLLGRATCAVRPPGTVLVVQPCDIDRHPTGPAVWVGPATARDAEAVVSWLRAGRLDAGSLPSRLTLGRLGPTN